MQSKEELELRKLELEIRDLSRPFWQRASYLAAAVPIVLAVLAFLSAWSSGYFERERARLKSETNQLRLEREALLKDKNQLQKRGDLAFNALKELVEAFESLQQTQREVAKLQSSPSPPSK